MKKIYQVLIYVVADIRIFFIFYFLETPIAYSLKNPSKKLPFFFLYVAVMYPNIALRSAPSFRVGILVASLLHLFFSTEFLTSAANVR